MQFCVIPLAIELERPCAFWRNAAVFATLGGLKDCDKTLGSWFLCVRHVRGDASGAKAGDFKGFAFLAGDMRGRRLFAKVDRCAAFKQTEGKPARHALKAIARLARLEFRMRGQHALHFFAQPFFDAFQRCFAAMRFGILGANQLKTGREPVWPWLQARNLFAFPGHVACIREGEDI